jgi:replicative DNA helicase
MDLTPPPHIDLAAERAVLGAVLADNQVMAQVSEVVVPDHFSNLGHQQIFSAMQALDLRQANIDHVTVAEELKIRGHLMQVGGASYLMTLDQAVPLAQNAVQYARIVKDKAARRQLAKAGREILELASTDVG